MKRSIKFAAIIVLLATLAVGTYVYLKPENTVSYLTEPVKRGSISQTVAAVGELTAAQLLDVGAQVSGQVNKLHVGLGQRVQKGDLIAEIDSTAQINSLNSNRAKLESFQAQLASAQTALSSAEKKAVRYRALVQEGAVSQEEWDAVNDHLAAARAKIRELHSSLKQTQIAITAAQADLSYTRIVAPISGTVVAVIVEEGQTVNANQSAPTIVQLANLDTMLNKIQIAEGDITKVKAGQDLSFTILSEPDQAVTGKLDSIDPGLTTMSKGAYSKATDNSDNAVYYYARALIPNSDGKLAIGMSTQNTIQINRAENVLIVPSVTVKQRDGNSSVRILNALGQPENRVVQTGMKDNMNTEIRAGLQEGDAVIVSEISSHEQGNKVNNKTGTPAPRM